MYSRLLSWLLSWHEGSWPPYSCLRTPSHSASPSTWTEFLGRNVYNAAHTHTVLIISSWTQFFFLSTFSSSVYALQQKLIAYCYNVFCWQANKAQRSNLKMNESWTNCNWYWTGYKIAFNLSIEWLYKDEHSQYDSNLLLAFGRNTVVRIF